VEITTAAFTDHLAALLSDHDHTVCTEEKEKGVWRMNITYLNEQPFQDKIRGLGSVEGKCRITPI
jgi:hypothetical protein